MILFILLHALCLTLLALAAYGAGALVTASLRFESGLGALVIRVAMGLVILGMVLFALGLAGVLNPNAVVAVMLVSVAFAIVRPPGFSMSRTTRAIGLVQAFLFFALLLPIFVLALYPPSAFDETLYHLPTIERFAKTGSLPFVHYLRMPVFPHLDEVLRVPLFLLGGDIATHLLSLIATLVTAGLLFTWFSEQGEAATGWLAVALFVSAPLVVHLATSGYVEALLAMFVTAAFYAFDRWRRSDATAWLLASALLAGSAASVKYFGLFWFGVLVVGVLAREGPRPRLRSATLFTLMAGLALAPWYGRILYFAGNPLFPFASSIFGHSEWDIVTMSSAALSDRLVALARLPWDLLFARERVGLQPPFSPGLVALTPIVLWQSLRDRLTGTITALIVVWSFLWTWLPPDSRLLVPALPLACVAGAVALRKMLGRLRLEGRAAIAIVALIVLLPGPMYAFYRLARNGTLPVEPTTREGWLRRRVPEYGAIAFLNSKAGRNDVAWLCGGEQLAYYFRGEMIGDLTGPARFDRLTSAPDSRELARRLAAVGARYVVVVKGRCEIPALAGAGSRSLFSRVFDDTTTTVYERTPLPSPVQAITRE